MTLSITGSSGFVGSHFMAMAGQNYKINEIDLLITPVDQVSFIESNAVLHLAALVHQMKGAPESEYFKVNTNLAFDVAKKAKDQGVKQFVFMSTVKVYGEYTGDGEAWNEQSLCQPIDPYGKSKLEGEQRVKSLQDENFKVAVVRTPVVYGKGVKANILNLTNFIEKYPAIPLGNINNKRSLTYVGNLVQVLDEVIKQNASGIFLACDGRPVSTSGLVMEIAKQFNKKNRVLPIPGLVQKMIKTLKPDIYQRIFGNLVVDNTQTLNSLGIKPKFSFSQGIQEMIKTLECFTIKISSYYCSRVMHFSCCFFAGLVLLINEN